MVRGCSKPDRLTMTDGHILAGSLGVSWMRKSPSNIADGKFNANETAIKAIRLNQSYERRPFTKLSLVVCRKINIPTMLWDVAGVQK